MDMPWIKSCLCHQEKKKPPAISPPIHLLLKPEGSNSPGPSHAFRCKTFKKPRPCHLCHQPIFNQGSCCRVCKYVCHKVCESKEAAERYADTSWKIHQDWHTEKKKSSSPKNGLKSKEQKAAINNNNDITESDHYARVEEMKNGTIKKHTKGVPQCSSQTKIIEIQTVQTTCETIPPTEKQSTATVEKPHSHDEPLRNGSGINKMLTSSAYNSNYETLTSQPRSVKHCNSSGGMDLSYVTERIIALWFPASCSQQSYRQGQRQAAHMLTNKHGDNYMVFNLSEPKRILRNEHKHVKEVGWSPRLAPPLERICSVCKEIDSWLSSDQHRIAVLHAKGSKDKLGVVVAAYMHYSSICGSAEQALDRFSMRKYLDDTVGPLQMPSNKRYVDYFAGLLSHNIKINTDPLYLTHVTVLGAPKFQAGGCRAFLKLYEGQNPVYTSGIYTVSSGVGQFTVNVAGERRRGLQLRGDILIKCYHRGDTGRETIFACQFHTCAVADYTLSFTRQELDVACNDSRFPIDGAIELHFSPGPERSLPTPAPTPAVPVIFSDDPIIRSDSPIIFEDSDDDDSDAEDVNHTFGPLDGSLYATITKKPELSPGAVSSPLTVSMDSGISSAGHHQNANTNASTSPPLTAQPSPQTPEDQHRELDELLSDMMLTVQSMPDPKPTSVHRPNHHQSPGPPATLNIDNVRYIDEEEDKNIPYHARQDSRPFSYGVNANMIEESKKLSSPSLVRKASFSKSSGDTLKRVQAQVVPDFSQKPRDYGWSGNVKYNTYSSSKYEKRDPIDDIFTESALKANEPVRRDFREELYKTEIKRYDPIKRSFTEGTLRRSPDKNVTYKSQGAYSDSESLSPPSAFRSKSPDYDGYSTSSTVTNGNVENLTWLQLQQRKLKEKREMQLREERQPYESRVMTELRSVHSKHMRPSASHRLDGYTSDTTAFADDDDEYSIPLHINIRNAHQSPGSAATFSTFKTTYSTTNKNERPFMAVKRAHEKYGQGIENTPASVLAANPLGHVVRSPSRGADTTDSGLLSLVEQQEHHFVDGVGGGSANNTYREEYSSSWRSQSMTDASSSSPHSLSSRPQTPAFPVARTPYQNSSTPTVQFDIPGERLPPKSPTTQRRMSFPSSSTLKQYKKGVETTERKDRPTSPSDLSNGSEYYRHYSESYQHSPKSPTFNGSASPTIYYGNSRRSSVHSTSDPLHEVSPVHVQFVRDTSKFWYKPAISREEAIHMLKDQPAGTFVVRDSNSFPGAFGMALKVSAVPPNLQAKSPLGNDELVRHFLIEPTSRGVRLKGCTNEPVFTSLSALVYQHSITPMALPCRLILPEGDIKHSDGTTNAAHILLATGAACNVLYLYSFDTESLTGPEAIKKTVIDMFNKQPKVNATIVHFKVNGQGITLTDNKRKLFFRKHYPVNTVSFCGIDPGETRWNVGSEDGAVIKSAHRIFGFVARKTSSSNDNQCHLFAELEPEQPASAIVNFVNKMLSSSGIKPLI
nr:tensin-like isoform X4 [Onthophagus taurus]